MINKKCRVAIDEVLEIASKHAKEIIRYRKTKAFETESVFTKEQLEEYSKYSDKKIKLGLQGHFLNELYFTFSKTYTFTAKELAEYTKVDFEAVKAFLKTFSCGFPSLKAEDKIYEPITILKTKPIIEHEGRYLLPSFPLLIWAVEDVIETVIKQNPKLNDKYPNIKHDFVLNEGLGFFKTLLPTATILQPNLFYFINNERCETDGLIIYDHVLFIIEAKGNRISDKAKSGHELKTQDHLKDIVRKSYEQGIRTLKYIEDSGIAEFKTKGGEKVLINRKDFYEIVIVSLTLEPVGNLSMSIKATNDIGYFNDGHFPWIISIYDLVIIADLIENPIMLIHYIKRRKNFLSHKLLSTYEELDLISYFISNGLYIEHTLKDAEEKSVNWIEYMPDTDEINDYYMYKFGHKVKYTTKPKFYISKEFNDFLLQLDRSRMPQRVQVGLLILEFNNESIKQLMDYIIKTKKAFAKDKGFRQCSVFTDSYGGIGITFMIGVDKQELYINLNSYCSLMLQEKKSNIWIGLGDISTNPSQYEFSSLFYEMQKNIAEL